MPSPFNFVLSDIDGTLLDGSRLLSQRTASAIFAARDAGACFALATGRMPHGLNVIFDTLGFRLPSVCLSGSLVLDENGDELFSTRLQEETTWAIMELVLSQCPDNPLSYFSGTRWLCENDQHPALVRESEIVHAKPETYCLSTAVHEGLLPNKLFCTFKPHDASGEKLAYAISSSFPDVTVIRSSTGTMIEIIPRGVSKWSGAQVLLQHLGLSASETLAFGDDMNDIPLLVNVGRGIAVANASESVLLAADEVCGAGTDDGVARYLETLFRKD